MAVTTQVPLNTMLADLDESLRRLLKRELDRHGFDGVEIVFDAPDKEWSSKLSGPTVNLFLYDLREAIEVRPIDWVPQPENGRKELRPPLRVDTSYAVTAWTRAVEDEHRLLSQVMAVLYAFPDLPADTLAGTLADETTQRYPLRTRVAQTKHEGLPDFWTAIGGQYKASIDYVVTVSCEPGTLLERGPEVRTQTVRFLDKDLGRSRMEELHRFAGVVRDADGEPVANAWVVLGEVGWAATDADGRFRFDKVVPGEHVCKVRAPDGSEVEQSVPVPGGIADIVVGAAAKKRAKSRG